jgi:GAF domain-containing protein
VLSARVTPPAAAPHAIARVAHTLPGALKFITQRAAEDVGRSCGAGLNLLTGSGRRISSVATDPIAERLNALHDLHVDNPCATAWSDRRLVRLDAFEIGDQTVESMLVAALSTETRLLGTLLVYSRAPAAYSASDEKVLACLADDAAILINEVQLAQSQFHHGTKNRQ